MIKIISWLPELTLRTLRVLSIGFMLLNSWSIYSSYARLQENPLLPRSIAHYDSFPNYFFIAFYLVIIFVIWKFLKGAYASKRWWVPVMAVFLFESFKFFIYGFLMWINPFE